MDISNLSYQFKLMFSEWLVAAFNKEAIAIFVIMVVSFFMLAAVFAYWAIQSGEFNNVEEAKFEMMEL